RPCLCRPASPASTVPSCACALSFCFPDPAPPAIFTLSLHDALPIFAQQNLQVLIGCIKLIVQHVGDRVAVDADQRVSLVDARASDRKSTRLNSSHVSISYAVFCLKKKNHKIIVFGCV